MPSRPNSFSRTIEKLSDRLFPIRSLAVAAVLLFIIGTAGFLSVEYLKRTTNLMVNDTLEGLADSSLANADLVEGFNCLVLSMMADNPADRERFRKDSDTYNSAVNTSIASYSRSIFTPEDLANYNRLLKDRKAYLVIRQQILKLIDGRNYAEARQTFKAALLPAYREYKSEAQRVMKYNADEGRTRGELILQICTTTQFLIATAGVALFVAGFLIGMFR
jgi:hypothetical protein